VGKKGGWEEGEGGKRARRRARKVNETGDRGGRGRGRSVREKGGGRFYISVHKKVRQLHSTSKGPKRTRN